MTAPPTYLLHYERVIAAFGDWPSFHDAQVVSFSHSTELSGEVRLVLHGWEMTSEVDDKGFYKMQKHHLVEFRFTDLVSAELDHFTANNILFSLDFSPVDDFRKNGVFHVVLDSAMATEFSGSFEAKRGEIVKVTSCDDRGVPLLE